MAGYNAEQADQDLNELEVLLRAWHNNRESDSVTIQDMRAREYEAGKRLIEGLVYRGQPERRLNLTVGETAIRAFRFQRRSGPGGPTTRSLMLEPGEGLELRGTRLATDIPSQIEELYAGFIIKTPMSEIARTLTEDGELSFMGAARPASEITG